LEIPDCVCWYVVREVRTDLPSVCQEFQARGIPGLSLPHWASDQDLSHLKGLTGLQELGLGSTKMTDAGLVHLKGLTGLQWLCLFDTQVTDAGCEKLRKTLPGLEIVLSQ